MERDKVKREHWALVNRNYARCLLLKFEPNEKSQTPKQKQPRNESGTKSKRNLSEIEIETKSSKQRAAKERNCN